MISRLPIDPDLNDPEFFLTWGRSAEHFQSGMHKLRGTHELCDLFGMVVAGQAFLFAGDDASVLTMISVYPRKRVASLFFMAGVIDEVREFLERGGAFDEWAKSQDCDRGQFVGRPGLKRVFEGIDHFGDLCIREFI